MQLWPKDGKHLPKSSKHMDIKMSRIIGIFFVWAILIVRMISTQGDCIKHINVTQGVLATDGFPNRLNFTFCQFHIDVGSDKIEVIFENVSLPDSTFIGFDIYSSAPKYLTVDKLRLESQVLYTKSHKASIFIYLRTNVSVGYKGMKFSYRRVSEDTCIYKYKSVINTGNEIQSPGFPNSYRANSTCEYLITASLEENVIQIGFRELSFGPGDVLTIYDATNNSVIFGPLSGLLESVETGPPSCSSSIKVVVNASSSPAVVRKYAFVFKELWRGTCVKDYYDGNLGVEQHISSAGQPCLLTVRSKRDTWLRLWFETINVSPGNFVFLALKESSGKIKMNWNLTSNDSTHVTNFDAVDKGNGFEIRQSSNVSFNLKFMSYSADKCPFYKESEEVQSGLLSPGYPRNFPRNSTCEFYFKAKDHAKIVNVRFTELVLTPGDEVTAYDPTDGDVIAKYDRTENLLRSMTSKGDSVRIIFTFSDNWTTVGRRFMLIHQALSPKKCFVEYVPVDNSGLLSSLNRSCEYKLYPSVPMELTFESIHVPQEGTITVFQSKSLLNYLRLLGKIRSEDTGETKYFKTIHRWDFDTIIVRTNATNVLFHMSFKPFISSRTVILQDSNGTLLSPYYPESYLRDIEQVFYVIVPSGHVMLNFTEVELFGGPYSNDMLTIYDGHTTSESAKLGYFEGRSPIVVPQWFLGSSNNITVKFLCSPNVVSGTNRFKAVYNMNTQVNCCDDLKWPNAHPERNLTLPGRTTKYFCNKDYLNPDIYNLNVGKWVSRKCGLYGEWEHGATLMCKRTCPKLDEKLKVNSTLRWEYSARFYFTDKPFDGTYVSFKCSDYYQWELNGPQSITCTSHGNYSAAPPTCKKRPKKETDSSSSSNAWKYGAGAGGALLIASIVIAVLRVCFGCFTCCDSVSASTTIPMSGLSTEKLT